MLSVRNTERQKGQLKNVYFFYKYDMCLGEGLCVSVCEENTEPSCEQFLPVLTSKLYWWTEIDRCFRQLLRNIKLGFYTEENNFNHSKGFRWNEMTVRIWMNGKKEHEGMEGNIQWEEPYIF